VGFFSIEITPSPKSHDQLVGLFTDLSVKCTDRGACPKVRSVMKYATGALGALTHTVVE
jgi:hypothetical protein